MRANRFIFKLTVCAFLGSSFPLVAQQIANTNHAAQWKGRYRLGCAPTAEYQKQMVRIMIEDVNRFAQQMDLSSNLLITSTNIGGAHVFAPCHCISLGEIGSIDAVNYRYTVDIRKGVKSAVRMSFLREFDDIRSKYTWSLSRLDTNAAFRDALQILKAADVDVDAISRDANSVKMTAWTVNSKQDFIPIYSIAWMKKGANSLSSLLTGDRLVFIKFLEPTKTIYELNVFNPEYIARKPLAQPDFVALLTTDPTNNPPEFVLREIESVTNADIHRQILFEHGASESDLKKLGLGLTNAPAATNAPLP